MSLYFAKSTALKILLISLLGCLQSARAQWVAEGYELKAGWNAIWLSHDASHYSIDNLFPTSVEEVWRWNPNSSTSQFTQSPSEPVQADTQWLVWKRGFPVDSTMSTLAPNSAYLVKVADGTATFNASITGKPVPPRYSWASSGLNFFGFPTKSPETNFETFLSYSGALAAGPGIFKYDGGAITSNPVQVNAPLFETVTRGKAYWIRSSQFTDFYGPLSVSVSNSGLAYGDSGTSLALKIKNVTDDSLDVTLTPVASVTPPTGQVASAGAVPLRLRGALNLTTAQFDYSDFMAATDLSIGAGEELDVVFAVDRAAMGGSAGDLFQSVLRLTDSLGITSIDIPVSASTTSRSGLWVGAAVVTAVDQITAAAGPLQPDGQGSVDVTTDADASAPSEFPIRLIVHRADDGTVKLLQQIYLGEGSGGGTVITPVETNLDAAELSSARRLSSSAFPLDAKITKTGADLGLSGTASFNIVLGHNAVTNPFVHTYHPDHDNKDAQFGPTVLAEGIESYTVARAVELTFVSDPSTLGLSDLGWGSTILGGTYTETLSGLRAQDITVRGSFVLRRVSDISTLTE